MTPSIHLYVPLYVTAVHMPRTFISKLKGMTLAGYFTQNRTLTGQVQPWVARQITPKGDINSQTEGVTLHPISETTTSYRSSGDMNFTSSDEIFRYFRTEPRNRFDTGHVFSSTKSWQVDDSKMRLVSKTLSSGNHLDAFGAMIPQYAIPTPVIPSINTNYYGNQAISAVAPTAPKASITQASVELLRDGLPDLNFIAGFIREMQGKGNFFRGLGGDYLNAQFGWVPFEKDLEQILFSVVHSAKILTQFQRDSGRIVRRGYGWPPKITSSITPVGNVKVQLGGNTLSAPEYWANSSAVQNGQGFFESRVSESYWFSGAFTYYLDPGKDLVGKMKRFEQLANQLLGTRITPAVLWQLLPWSWLVDWYVSVTGALKTQALFQNDGLVMKYGYLMRTTQAVNTISVTGLGFNGSTNASCSSSKIILKKERVQGTPFGFGVNPNSFTGFQWSILAALGLSKSAR
jgi:hypothetical protein